MSDITSYKRFSARNLEFGKLQPRGKYHFSNISYKGQPLIIETPALITPNGINADEARNWMDVELNIASDPEHQALYDMYKVIDDRCIKECINNIGKWFSKTVDEAFIEEEYKSPITSGWGNEPASLRIEIVSDKPEDLVDSNGVPISPNEVTALSSVVVQMQLLGIWASEKYLGCHWRALAIKANLDHERLGRRRSESPRVADTPPQRLQRENFNARNALNARSASASATSKPTPVKSVPKPAAAPAAAAKPDVSKARVQEMLQRFREQRRESQSHVRGREAEPEEREVDEDELPSDGEVIDRRRSSGGDYSDDDRRRSSGGDYSDDDRRRRSSGDYSDDGRRHEEYSDDDRRRHSDYSDDDRRRSSEHHYRSSRRH